MIFFFTTVVPNNAIIASFDSDKKIKMAKFRKNEGRLSYLTCSPEIFSILLEMNTERYFPKFLTLK